MKFFPGFLKILFTSKDFKMALDLICLTGILVWWHAVSL